MSALRVLWPEETLGQVGLAFVDGTDAEEHETDGIPDVVPFASHSRQAVPRQSAVENRFDMVTRARTLFENRSCPRCQYPVVEPIELADGFLNRNGMTVPGTATLVGFRCRGCRCEWSV